MCLGGFLYSIAYGVTFLLPTLVKSYGGDEALAGLIISAATISTVTLVIFSGHIADTIGATRAVSISGLFLAMSGLGFALLPSNGHMIVFVGLVLGTGWGIYYTIGPILVATLIEAERRIKFLALLSGSMMAGIGAGPIIGRIATELSLPIELAFYCASLACVAGGLMYMWLHKKLKSRGSIVPNVSKITFRAVREITFSNSVYSIAMVGIGGAIFGGLSSFQTSYADQHGYDYSLFFIGFMSAVILCRLLLAGYVIKLDPFKTLVLLTSMTLLSIVLFIVVTNNSLIYLLTAVLLGTGYGLTYSVINGLAANEAPANRMPQALLLFSLSYFVGVFGFPLFAGNIIVTFGVDALLLVILVLAASSWAIVLYRFATKALAVKMNV